MILWVFLVIFVLNMAGNLFARTHFEKFFSALTLLFAFLIWRVLRENSASRAGAEAVDGRAEV